MQKSFKITLAIIIILLLGAGAWFYMSNRTNKSNMTNNGNQTPAPNVVEQATKAQSDFTAGKTLSYTHPDLGFSFLYPEGFKIGNLEDDQGQTVLVQKDNIGFQIYISPLAQEIQMTADFVKKDLPNMVMESPVNINIDGITALAFNSKNDSGQNTGEVWFWKNGQLYQITTNIEFGKTLAEIIKTWKWE